MNPRPLRLHRNETISTDSHMGSEPDPDVWQVAVETVIAWQEHSGAPNTRDEALAILGARCAGSDKHEVVGALDGAAEGRSAATSRLSARVKKHRFKVLPFASHRDVDRAGLISDVLDAAPVVPASAAESIVDFVVYWHWER